MSKTMMSGTKAKNLARTEPRKKVSKGPSRKMDEDLDPIKASAVTDVANQVRMRFYMCI